MTDLSQIIDNLPSLRETVEVHGLMAKKALGQNFLLDRNITDKIIRTSLERQNKNDFNGEFVFEVGPGPGGLTRSVLAQNPEKLTVIEMDDRCIAIMQEIKEKVGENKLQIINGDAMKQDFAAMEGTPKNIVSNLPYNISVPLLVGWLKKISAFDSLTLMFQKEVADRICAQTRCKDYGRISILSQLLCKVERLFDINPNCFVPAPKIWSTVVLFRPSGLEIDEKTMINLEKLTTMAFSQRRKMIRQSLKSIPDLENKAAPLGINLTMRAEEITPQQYLQLAKLL